MQKAVFKRITLEIICHTSPDHIYPTFFHIPLSAVGVSRPLAVVISLLVPTGIASLANLASNSKLHSFSGF